jgi:hypothetical protein
MSSVVVKIAPAKKSKLSWRVYVALLIPFCLAIQFVLLKISSLMDQRYYDDPSFENAAFLHKMISMAGTTSLFVILGSVLSLIFIPLRLRSFLLAFVICTPTADLAAIMVPVASKARQAAFLSRVKRPGNNLIGAIKHFSERTGRLPVSLEELIPDYLAAIPGTGIARFPQFNYEPAAPATKPSAIWNLKFEYRDPQEKEFVLFYAGMDLKNLVGAKSHNEIDYPEWAVVSREEFYAKTPAP